MCTCTKSIAAISVNLKKIKTQTSIETIACGTDKTAALVT